MYDIPAFWHNRHLFTRLLMPLAKLFTLISNYRRRHTHAIASPIPIIVIGNISVGGNGKTPIVQALARQLTELNYAVGIISRGYKSQAEKQKHAIEVQPDSHPTVVGDEPLLLRQTTGCPTAICPNRNDAISLLLQRYPHLQLILSDDGLQHYAMARACELVVIAPDIGLGNGLTLPAGPLREPPSRLDTVDAILYTGAHLHLHTNTPQYQIPMHSNGLQDLDGNRLKPQQNERYYALTAIARPERFLHAIAQQGITLSDYRTFKDHAPLPEHLADFAQDGWLIVTAKDAVKLIDWSEQRRAKCAVLDYHAHIPEVVIDLILKKGHLP